MVYISKETAIGGIDWDQYHNAPCPEELPNGQWGINPAGDYYLNNFDNYDSYYYFNKDGSWYFREGVADDPDDHTATYVNPEGEKIYRPSTVASSQARNSYFIGIDWQSGHEKIYWDDGTGKIVRTFRKDITDDKLEKLSKFKVRTLRSDGKDLIFDVTVDGSYEGSDPDIKRAMKMERKREERSPSNNLLRTPRHIPLPPSPVASPQQANVSRRLDYGGAVRIKAEPVIKVEPINADDPFAW